MKIILNSFLMLSVLAFGQNKIDKDRQAIKAMCGCYEVTFQFAETFAYQDGENYKASPNKVSKGLELALLIEDQPGKISIQHLLIVGNDENQQIVKHWRQDWIYQNQDLYTFRGDNNWGYNQLPYNEVTGQWTQKVYQVDDSPRYEGSASWVHIDGRSYWENTTPAPLPRREYSIRNDYNILMRTNHVEINEHGWVHEQDNSKILTKNNTQTKVADEKGYNSYVKVNDNKCSSAQEWWNKNQNYWQLVRNNWSEVFNEKQNLILLSKVDDKPLFSHLFELQDKKATQEEIKKTIASFRK